MSQVLILVLALILASVSPAMAGTIVQNPILATSGSVPYSFSTTTNTFSSEGFGSFNDGVGGAVSMTLNATFTDLGAFVGGTFEFTGEIPSLGIPAGSLLMQGVVTGVSSEEVMDTSSGDVTHFRVVFDLDFDTVHPLLFAADVGIWDAPVCNSTSVEDCGPGPGSIEDLFTTDYTDSRMPLNTFIFSSHHVPYPAAGLLLGLGLALLAARQRLHWSAPAEEEPPCDSRSLDS
jgi:hypothetical protein